MTDQIAETKARRRWLGFISLFFLAQAALWTFAINVVSNDSSHAVVSDYDGRALRWDELAKRREASEKLGWTAELAVNTAEQSEAGTITLSLSDREQAAIEGADVRLTLFHRGEAANRQVVSLMPQAPGVYLADARLHKPGHWRFEVIAVRGADTFVFNDSQEIGVQ